MALLKRYLYDPVEAAPLAVFRILFGIMMFFGLLRFWHYGWIESFYLEPQFHFSYYGFEWVKPLGPFTYILFILCALAALGVALGYFYRLSIIVFFLSFTYIELMDKTTYLNHYYFISVLSFFMMFLPAASYFSLDAYLKPRKAFQFIPAWTINGIKLLLCMVYFYAGLAKLNSDWLWEALPLKIWLPAKTGLPLIGDLLAKEWMHYIFSWAGAIFDLFIPFLLLIRKTRLYAFELLVTFHVLTWVLFPIGMFPFIMIISSLIFFDSSLHKHFLETVSRLIRLPAGFFNNNRGWLPKRNWLTSLCIGTLVLFYSVQLLFPWRYLLYPGELFWTEEGYRFSWRVMLMEKSGYAQFKVVNKKTGQWVYVDNSKFLTPFQEKQMAFQPDFILEFAHFLEEYYEEEGVEEVGVYVDSQVALNGRLSQPYIDPDTDLTREKESFKHKKWVLPLHGTIKGF